MRTTLRSLSKWWNSKLHFNSELLKSKVAYALGKRRFPNERKLGRPLLSELSVVIVNGENPLGLTLPPEYSALVDRIAAEADRRLSLTRNCLMRSYDEAVNKKLAAGPLPERTADIPEMKDKLVGSLKLKDSFGIDGVDELAAHLLPQIESRVYHSFIIVDEMTVYRNLHSTLPEFASRLWHSDNHLEGVVKIMIYLNDVSEKNAPFEYLRHAESGKPIHVKPSMPQKYPHGRVPQEVIDAYKRQGYASYKVTGKKGTMLLFDDKIIHKGNVAEEGYRDVLVLELRPSSVKRPYIDRRWTLST